MLKLAVIFESSPFDRKGLFNAVHNRVKHLVETGECEIDVFCIHIFIYMFGSISMYPNFLTIYFYLFCPNKFLKSTQT